jgi:hypothetical protein
LSCDSTRLSLLLRGCSEKPGHGLDVYVDGDFWRTVYVEKDEETSAELFDEQTKVQRSIEIYLPYRQELQIGGVEVDAETTFGEPQEYRIPKPVVFYGSSVCQGVGAGRPSMSYEAVAARTLDIDYVNLGFGGAGKAEPEVVDLVAGIDAACFVFDLGKSYGLQPYDAYDLMLSRMLNEWPGTPIICMTPIYSARERYWPDYVELSRHTRDVVWKASKGKAGVTVVDGLELLGPQDGDAVSRDGTHPTELGFKLIADRLLPRLRDSLVM